MTRKHILFLSLGVAICFLLGFLVGFLNLALPIALAVGVALAFFVTGRDIVGGKGR